MITITDGTRTINIEDEKVRILETDMVDLIDWIENAVNEKLRRILDDIIIQEETIVEDPRKIAVTDKLALVKNKPLKSGKEKNADANKLMG